MILLCPRKSICSEIHFFHRVHTATLTFVYLKATLTLYDTNNEYFKFSNISITKEAKWN